MSVNFRAFLMLALVIAVAGCKDENASQNVEAQIPSVAAVKVEPQNIPLTFEYAARAQGSKETEVRARVSGILLKRNYIEGSTVNAGDILFQIDPEPYEVALLQAKARLSQEEAQLRAAETQWERVSKLFKDKIVSEKTRDEARANLDSLKATTDLARAELRSAQLNLDYTTVTAPISGITSLETQSEGSLISATEGGSLLTNITQLDPIYVVFSASDSEMFKLGSMIENGQIVNPRRSKDIKARIKSGSGKLYPQEGVINFINPTIDENTGTIKLRTIFENPERTIMPGQFVRLVLEGLTRKDAIVLPKEAVMQGAQGSFVYKINDQGLIESVNVETGFTTKEGEWIIDSGLQNGDIVVVNDLMKMRVGIPAKANLKVIPREVVVVKSEDVEQAPALAEVLVEEAVDSAV